MSDGIMQLTAAWLWLSRDSGRPELHTLRAGDGMHEDLMLVPAQGLDRAWSKLTRLLRCFEASAFCSLAPRSVARFQASFPCIQRHGTLAFGTH